VHVVVLRLRFWEPATFSALYGNVDHREPEEDVQSLVTVQLIVAVLNGFARPVGGRSIANQDPARHFSLPHG
jgi:hypothetical protein